MLLPIQIVMGIFLLFAISRVYLRAKDGSLSVGEGIFWISLFAAAILGVVDPRFTTYVASMLGIGRGADVVLYISIVLLFYMIFRINVMIENLHHQVTRLIREVALKEYGVVKKKESSKTRKRRKTSKTVKKK